MIFTAKKLKASLTLGLALVFGGLAFAQAEVETPLFEDGEETALIVFVLINTPEGGLISPEYPVCLNEFQQQGQSNPWYSDFELSLKPEQCAIIEESPYSSYIKAGANKVCKGAVGAVFGGTTGKLLTRFFGGENLSRMLEIAGTAEVSGHSSGQFICEYLLGESEATQSYDIGWLLESNDFSAISPTTLLDQVWTLIPTIGYEISSIAARGTIVFLVVKQTLGIGNPVIGFFVSMPIRSIYDFLRSYGESILRETFFGNDTKNDSLSDEPGH